jgi:hypothetical protein
VWISIGRFAGRVLRASESRIAKPYAPPMTGVNIGAGNLRQA